MVDIKEGPGLTTLAADDVAGDDVFAIWDASAQTWKRISYADMRLGLADWRRLTSSYSAFAGDLLDCDTSAGAFTVTLPAAPIEGDRISFNDFAGTWAANALSIDPNGNEFEDLGDGSDPAQPLICAESAQFSIVFADGLYRIR